MGDFFNVDNKFFQGLGKIIDVICLSAFWFFLCIPIVTAGAATTALYYTVNKVILEQPQLHRQGVLACI